VAYLNVRERRIETKIAYVGDRPTKTTSSLKELVSLAKTNDVELDGETGDIRSLEWRPPSTTTTGTRFNDCDVAVRVVTSKSGELEAVLADGVDGIILGADEDQLLIGTLGDRVKVPFVVQAEGEGVMQTLEALLVRVIDQMKTPPEAQPASPSPSVLDQNPLLSALRDVMRETVREQMATVEAQAAARIAAVVEATIAERDARDEELRRTLQELRSMVATTSKETARAYASQAAALTDVSARVAEIHAATLDLVTRRDLESHQAHLRDELGSRSRSEREHMTTSIAVLRRSLDAITLDLKKVDLREKKLQEIGAEVHMVSGKLDALASTVEPTAISVGMVPSRITAVTEVLQREVREVVLPKLARLEDSVQVLHVDTGGSLQRADQRASEIQGGLNELLEELKKRKKGWFS